jgi:hypothetical protein
MKGQTFLPQSKAGSAMTLPFSSFSRRPFLSCPWALQKLSFFPAFIVTLQFFENNRLLIPKPSKNQSVTKSRRFCKAFAGGGSYDLL